MSTIGTYSNRAYIDDDCGKGLAVELSEKSVKTNEPGTQTSEDIDYDPYLHRKVEHPLTNSETLVHLLKIALGTGIFAMPNAFNHAGFLVGLIGTIIIGIITNYCVHMLVNTHYILCKRNKVPSLTYPLIAEAALLSGPRCFHKFAPYMIHIVNAFILLYEIGSCCIYVVFIASNCKELYDYFFDTDTDIRLIMLVLLLPLILINWSHSIDRNFVTFKNFWTCSSLCGILIGTYINIRSVFGIKRVWNKCLPVIRNLKYLAPLSTIGTIATIVSFGIICYYIFREPLTLEGKHAVGRFSQFPLFFGTVLFALEAIAVIMPLENEMKTPRKFIGVTGILNRAMCVVIALYVGLGLCGYLKYGDNIKSSITLNLPQRELPAQIVKTMISCGVFISNAIVTQVAIDLAWTQYFINRLADSTHKLTWEYGLRTSIVCLTFLLAIAIPNLELFISLMGALTLSTLGLTIPAFLECCTRWNSTDGLYRATLILKDVVIASIGLAGLIIGTTISMRDIIQTYFD